MTSIDLSFYLVLDPDLCGGADGMVNTAIQAARAGATCVQLRAPRWSREEILACGKNLKEALRAYRTTLIINNDPELCVALDADGVHVGQNDIAPEKARRIIGQTKYLGLSVSTAQEASKADPLLVDYLGVGPVFPTATKPDAAPATGLEGLAKILRSTSIPCVAIGGITTKNIRAVLATGVQGVAVVSAVCGTRNPELAAREFTTLVRSRLSRTA